MGGVAGGEGALGQKQGSLQGIAGVLLQNTLPRARVLYASADGGKEAALAWVPDHMRFRVIPRTGEGCKGRWGRAEERGRG